ncbi:MAG: GDSL-type esterase/lipase family protein [Candidatus Microsaccharimonas sp.]
MARLPTPGSDAGSWGEILNEYLMQSLTDDGSLKANTVGAAQLKPLSVTSATINDGNVTSAKLADGVVTPAKLAAGSATNGQVLTYNTGNLEWSTISNNSTAPDATSSVKGVVQLTGDLSGTAASPTVAKLNGVGVSGAPTSGQILTASSSTTAAWTAPTPAPVTSVASKTGAVTLVKADVGLDNADNTSDADKPVSNATQTALNAKQSVSEKGIANGYASLDSDTRLPDSQVPARLATSQLNATIAAAIADANQSRVINPSVVDAARGLFSLSQAIPIRAVFLGSSTTQGVNASTTQYSWASLFTEAVQRSYSNGGTEKTLRLSPTASWGAAKNGQSGFEAFNGGAGGNTSATYVTTSMVPRLKATEPHVYIHMIGANDFSSNVDPAIYQTNIETAITSLNDVTSTQPLHILLHTFWRGDSYGAYPWEKYWARLVAIAQANPNRVAAIDIHGVHQALGWPGTDPYDLIDDADQTHQRDYGHRVMAQSIISMFNLPMSYSSGLIAQTVQPTRLMSDGFTTAATPIDGRTSDNYAGGTGITWASNNGQIRTDSGVLKAIASPTANDYAFFASTANKRRVAAYISSQPTTGSWGIVVASNGTVTASSSFVYAKITNGGALALVKRVAATETTLITGETFVNGDTVAVNTDLTTGVYQLFKNGKLLNTVTDNVINSGTGSHAGIFKIGTSGSVSIDHFTFDTF